MLCGRTSKIRLCDKGILANGRCVVVWYSKVKSLCFAFVDRSIYCHYLLSLAVRHIITCSTIKSLRTIVEVTCCDIKVKLKKLDGCVIIDSPRLWSRYKYFVQTLPTIRSTSVIVCMYKKSTEPCSERNFQFEEEKAKESMRANSQLSRGSSSSRLQFVQSKLPIKIPTLRRKFAKLRGKEHPVWL